MGESNPNQKVIGISWHKAQTTCMWVYGPPHHLFPAPETTACDGETKLKRKESFQLSFFLYKVTDSPSIINTQTGKTQNCLRQPLFPRLLRSRLQVSSNPILLKKVPLWPCYLSHLFAKSPFQNVFKSKTKGFKKRKPFSTFFLNCREPVMSCLLLDPSIHARF